MNVKNFFTCGHLHDCHRLVFAMDDTERNERHEMLRKKLRQKRAEARGGGGSHTRQNIDPASLLMSLGVNDVNLLQAATAVTPAMIKTLASQSTAAAPHTTTTQRSSRDQTGAKKDAKDKEENKEENKKVNEEVNRKDNKADEDDEEAPPVLW